MSRTDTPPDGSRRNHAPHDQIDTAFTWLFAGSFEAALITASAIIAVHASIHAGIAVFIGVSAVVVAMHHVITTNTTLDYVA